MARKFIRKLMVTMIVLLILILLEVQTNNLVSTSSYPSLSNPLSIPFELDNVEGPVYNCLDVNVAHCKKMAKKSSVIFFAECVSMCC